MRLFGISRIQFSEMACNSIF
ncbi:MAG: hypothetical protein LBS55_05520 [Prevotellaceae bacterium]|nr:hypothetical protein [Prevotellaceae bacterium]